MVRLQHGLRKDLGVLLPLEQYGFVALLSITLIQLEPLVLLIILWQSLNMI